MECKCGKELWMEYDFDIGKVFKCSCGEYKFIRNTRGDLVKYDDHLAEMTKMQKRIGARDEYIKVLESECSDLMGLHIAHGMTQSNRYEDGVNCRKAIEEADKSC
jgi:hypothetical protein